jgi:transcription-repair coupling factor (superfamily II helicase)
VHRLRGNPPPRRLSASVDLPIRAYIPDDYVSDEGLRLNIYQRLAAATDPDRLGQIALELQDRFGPPPEPVLSLLFVAQVRCAASAALVESVSKEGSEVVLRRPQGVVFRREDLPPGVSGWLRIGANQVGIRADDGPLQWQARLSALLDHLAGPRAQPDARPQKAPAPVEPRLKPLRATAPPRKR